MNEIPFEDDTFDLILCNHVLEHVPTDDVAMKELTRVLKPGGTAILQVPISANSAGAFEGLTVADRERGDLGQFDHVRIYGQLVARLEHSGFPVDR